MNGRGTTIPQSTEGVPHQPTHLALSGARATTQVVSVALVVEWEGHDHSLKVQRLVYFISKVLTDSETHYGQVQKLLYVILIVKHKLLHYYESHSIIIVTSHGLGEIVNNWNASKKIMKWVLVLMGLDITYVPCTAIKS
jgi:hypothetical protein